MFLILLTNDDGIEAEGLRCLEQCLQGIADLVVVAPDRERSAVSHGLTIHSPLELNKLAPNRYTLNGTPADCIIYALEHLTAAIPDLVISGINHGANLGDDIIYSGTVAAAREASRHGISALAISQAFDERPIDFDAGVKFIPQFVSNLLLQRLGSAVCFNVNIPVRKIKGAKITRQGIRSHFMQFNSLGGNSGQAPAGSADGKRAELPLDFEVILDHYVSITPLQRDQTDYAAAQALLLDAGRLF